LNKNQNLIKTKGFIDYFTIEISKEDMTKITDGIYQLKAKVPKAEMNMEIIVKSSIVKGKFDEKVLKEGLKFLRVSQPNLDS